ncbi:MAG: enoyl-CoA hydratase, partial [Betaproteobacteria bacterium]|nr:enoyl-CoA hydratase [Betaproteobacteria bacterium]
MHLVNRTYDELAAGDSAELKRLITTDDLFAFAVCSGNHNPLHLSEAIASQAHSPQQS